MTKNDFLTELEQLLRKIPEDERRDILYDFEEHFRMAAADGKREEEIVALLGKPKTLAKELTADYLITNAKENRSAGNIARAVLAVIALGSFNLIFVLGPFVGIAAVIFALYAVAFTLLVVPVKLLFQMAWADGGQLLAGIFNMMMSIGLGILLIIGLIYLTRWIYVLLIRYLQYNLRVVKGG
ncbi:hypothetical protein ACFO4N_02630 [Camelliibacillus cellulosilyticus]|uniref:DUF1700 domain-containing protein n=1 Tax=Camelliibacillus cellulosilyticus TaxID=2174486 RepID=A0ABV9GH66_9BACL